MNQVDELLPSEDDRATNGVYKTFINLMLDLGEKPADIAFGIGFALQQVSKPEPEHEHLQRRA